MEVLAEVERSGFVESRHLGVVAVVSPAGELLAAAGLEESDLRCPPILPGNREARARAEGPAAVYHNCSGKHAYMLAGSVARGWETDRYTEPEHPLQAVVADTLSDYAGVPIEHVGVDGCGVPVHAMSLRGLATAYARLGAQAAGGEEGPAALVAAGRRHPFMVAGSGQLDTVLLAAAGPSARSAPRSCGCGADGLPAGQGCLQKLSIRPTLDSVRKEGGRADRRGAARRRRALHPRAAPPGRAVAAQAGEPGRGVQPLPVAD